MGKPGKAHRKMDQNLDKDNENDSFVLDTNSDGSTFTRERRWDSVRRLSRRIAERERATNFARRVLPASSASTSSQPGVQLLPRRDVQLYGTIPSIEERIYGTCTNCNCVYNPRNILNHRNCVRNEPPAPPVVKKKVQSKNVNSKKPSNGSISSYPTNSNIPAASGASSSLQDPLKLFEFKRPFTPPPTKAEPTLPQLKVSVTKIGFSKSSRSSTVTSTATHTATATTSSEKVDSKVSSKVSSATHHSSKSSSGHHSSRGHNPKSPSSSSSSTSSSASSSSSSSSGHHGSRNTSSHHSPKSPSSSGHHTSKSSSVHYNPRSPSSKSSSSSSSSSSHHGSSHGSHHSSKSSSSSSTKSTPMDTLPASTSSTSHHHHTHSSRHKKSSSGSSKRSASSSSSTTSSTSTSSSSSKSLPKNYDPDTHCGVVEGNKGPCMRSITCSNHRLHLRKQVPGRSKDIHQLIAERKAAKENDLKQVPGSYASPNGEAKDTKNLNTTYVPTAAPVASTSIESKPSTSSTFVPIMPRAAAHQTRQATTSVLGAKKLCTGIGNNESASTLTNGHSTRSKNLNEENTQESVAGTVPLVFLPVNVSNATVLNAVQLLKIGNNIITLESPQSAANTPLRKQVILPISGTHTNGIRMYKSHPKPIILPNFGARKLGGAIILANPLLDDQRNNLLTTIDLKLETVNIERGLSGLNHSNSPHRPNILKGKGSVKVNCKRPASDKLTTGDSKRLVPDVNGFILETDVTETADALQYSGDNELSQHESIIRLIDQHGF